MFDMMTQQLDVYYCNVRSIGKQLPLNSSVFNRHDVIAFTETWLTSKTTNKELGLEKTHTWFRRDRGSQTGGGVACAIKTTLEPDILTCGNTLEALFISLKRIDVTLVVFYKPPRDKAAIWEFTDELRKIDGKLVVVGDFNLPKVGRPTRSRRCKQKAFIDCLHRMKVKQWVTEPTRGQNILDLVFTRYMPATNVRVQKSKTFVTDHKEILADLAL